MCKEGRRGGAKGDWQSHTSETNRDPRKSSKSWNLFVPGQLTPADLSLVLRLLQIFDEQSLFFTYFITSLGETPPDNGLFLQTLKPQAEFSLIISISIAEVTGLKAMGKIQAGIKVEWERASSPLCCRERSWQAVSPLRPHGSWVTELSPSPDYVSCGPIAGSMGCPCKDVTLN